MAIKAQRKSPIRPAAKPVVDGSGVAAAAPVETAIVSTALPPVTDAVPALTGKVPLAAVAAVESVVETIAETATNLKAAVDPAALSKKGKTMADTVKNLTEDMTKRGEKLFADAKGRTEDVVAKGQKFVGDLNDFNKGNIEALVESGKIAAKGFEKLGQDQAEYARKSFEQTTAAFKGMAAVKSPTELVKLHSDYVRTSFDALVAQTSHSTEAFLKLAGEIAQPISNRFAVAAEKVKLAA